MAFSASKQGEQLLGAWKTQVYNLNFASVTEGAFKTGLTKVLHAEFVNNTSEAQGLVKPNSTLASAAQAGSVFVSSVTSNDVGTLLVIGF
jgi:hypothetical protein